MENLIAACMEAIPAEHQDRKVNDYITQSGEWDWISLERLLPLDILLHLDAFKTDLRGNENDVIT